MGRIDLMIFVTERFKKQYNRLSTEYKHSIHEIVNNLSKLSDNEKTEYLVSLCGSNGKAKWNGTKKTFYHLYPQKSGMTHRLFYCYVSDLDDKTREKSQMYNGIVFIDYTTRKEDEDLAARNYERTNILNFSQFTLPIDKNTFDLITKPTKPVFWFCLTRDQKEVLELPQPSLIKGSAGAGKTLISFELFKDWINHFEDKKLLYLTYTDKLLYKAKKAFEEDGVNLENRNISIGKFFNVYNQSNKLIVIDELKARQIIKQILIDFDRMKKLPSSILYNDYFVYSYIRGIMKGRIIKNEEKQLDIRSAKKHLQTTITNSNLSFKEKDKIISLISRYLDRHNLTYDFFIKEIYSNMTKFNIGGSEKDFKEKILGIFNPKLFDELNQLNSNKITYNFLSEREIKNELAKDGVSEDNVHLLIDIKNKYENFLNKENLMDDNDYAMMILNDDIEETDKYDGIIIDEVQDFTETQIGAIVKLSKEESNYISFFGDPNQTINPTVYDYGRFNAQVYTNKKSINRKKLTKTHRCGPNLLEYINHLTRLREEFKLTTIREDLEPDISARDYDLDTYWACLVEDDNLIKIILDNFLQAEDCYLIVDNTHKRQDVINQIKAINNSVDTQYLEDQIITVQDSKGLESRNVILYDLISDNVHILSRLLDHNDRVYTMTFNKLYVSTTRAQDSIIIYESKLKDYPEIKNTFFYYNNKKMVEDIGEDDIPLYLHISIDPKTFLNQAKEQMEIGDYQKAKKKSDIALRNVLDQFNKDEDIQLEMIRVNDKTLLNKMSDFSSKVSSDEIESFRTLYEKLVKTLESSNHVAQDNSLMIDAISSNDYKLIKERYYTLLEIIKVKNICEKRIQFDELKTIMSEKDKIVLIEDFLELDNYDCAIDVTSSLSMAKKSDYQSIVKYMYGYESYDNVVQILDRLAFQNMNTYKLILDKQLFNDVRVQLSHKIQKLRGYVNERI